jgi:hypothetical protein
MSRQGYNGPYYHESFQEKEIVITGETDLLNIDLGEFVYTPRE